LRDQWLEQRPAQVEAAEQRIERLPAGQPLGVPGNVHHAGVAAAGDHHDALVADVHDERLIIEHERVGLPASVEPGLLRREAWLVPRGPGDLAGDQHGPAEQEAGLAFLDSAISASGTCPSVISADARRGLRPGSARRAGPWSAIRLSVELSIRVTTTTEFTGSRSISTAGSTSCRSAAARLAGLSSVHTAPS
jgi:hypothetical protein